MGIKRLILLAASISLMALWGCSSSMDSAGDKGGSGGTLQEQIDAIGLYVGPARCINCHSGFSWSADVINSYLGTKKPAPEEGEEDTRNRHVFNHVTQAANTDYAALFPGVDCLACHDFLGDSQLLEEYLNPADVPEDGLTAVTCEVCHGSGIDHYGIGPIPYPTPGPERCGQCHDKQWEVGLGDPYSRPETVFPAHIAFHPEGFAIKSDWEGSPHFEADGRNEPRCVKCHNHEGARAYKNVHTAEQLYTLALPLDGEISSIQCRTCHNPHDPKELLLGESEIELPLADDGYDASAEYATCTNCHQPADAQLVSLTYKAGDTRGTEGDFKTYSDWVDDMNEVAALGITDDQNYGDLIYHAARFERVISSTHWDNPITNDDSPPEMIEGYVVNPESERACRDCHNPHSADITINRQWASSGHGGHILEAKEAAGADDHTLEGAVQIRMAGSHSAWSAHVWSRDEEANCQRCHTATGARSFLNGPTAYYTAIDAFIDAVESDPNQTAVPSPNDYSYLIEGQGELLYCWACHTNNVGAIRNPGSVWLQDRDRNLFGPIPDIGKSNVCVGCHGGRANSDFIRNTPAANRSSSGRVHHLPAAAVLFSANTKTGYQFDLDGDGDAAEHYKNSIIEHDKIGVSAGDGPCATCHMLNDTTPGPDHHFEVVTKDDAGTITAINHQTLCDNCHALNPTKLQTLSEEYQNLLLYLTDVVNVTNGQTNYVGISFDNATFLRSRPDDVSGQNDYGAHQNWEFTRVDGGFWGYAHNSTYTRRLVFDSLDWLDNGSLDGTITIPLTYPGAIQWIGGDPVTGVVASRPMPGQNIP